MNRIKKNKLNKKREKSHQRTFMLHLSWQSLMMTSYVSAPPTWPGVPWCGSGWRWLSVWRTWSSSCTGSLLCSSGWWRQPRSGCCSTSPPAAGTEAPWGTPTTDTHTHKLKRADTHSQNQCGQTGHGGTLVSPSWYCPSSVQNMSSRATVCSLSDATGRRWVSSTPYLEHNTFFNLVFIQICVNFRRWMNLSWWKLSSVFRLFLRMSDLR